MNNTTKGEIPLSLVDAEISEVNVDTYNRNTINSITTRYPVLRQDSKGP